MKRWGLVAIALVPFSVGAAVTCGGQTEPVNDASLDADAGDASTTDVAHRPFATPCDGSRPPGNAYPGLDAGCTKDDDCDAGVNGRCIGVRLCSIGCEENVCSYDTCLADDACSGNACTCRETFPKAGNTPDTCDLVGNCRVDSDCPNGQFCSPSYVPGCAPPAYYCRTPNDECIADSDCGGFMTCGYDPAKQHWKCSAACTDG